MLLTLPETYPCPKCGKKADALLYLHAPERVRYSCHNGECGHKFTVQKIRGPAIDGDVQVHYAIIEGAV